VSTQYPVDISEDSLHEQRQRRAWIPGAIQATTSVHDKLHRDCLFRPRGSFYLPRVGAVQTFILASRL
jgi:hypothetical protein